MEREDVESRGLKKGKRGERGREKKGMEME